ncbi:hypothetical protein [Sphingopyxis sp. GW247-27LB]|uniref:phage tail tube protein n=1 Tax=Sphingopyxis sp. GW247-27LB TaxID=2012632 RepID=UPI000BA6D0C3|nr:hypothetical protein [Sphingopyxis sp. GW247-27LB]PAL23537.1 hypothetical protein CD928_05575 [Sphingopyxis sp. GW247-27LB]
MSKINRENLTIGRGRLFFKPTGETGFRPLGNTPAFNLNVATETLPHFDSRQGVRVQDADVPVQTTYGANFTADHIQSENLAIFLQGSNQVVAVAAATEETEVLAAITLGYMYELPAKKVANVTAVTGATPLVAGTDFTVDLNNGTVEFLLDATAVGDGDPVTITYDIVAHSFERVSSGAEVVEGQLRFIADNPHGEDKNYLMGAVKLTPNGDFGVISEEWQSLPFTVVISTPVGGSAITCDGQPYTPA